MCHIHCSDSQAASLPRNGFRNGFLQVRVNKWLKDLERMFYGSCESYEKVHSIHIQDVLLFFCCFTCDVSINSRMHNR